MDSDPKPSAVRTRSVSGLFPLKSWRRPYPVGLFVILIPLLWVVGAALLLKAGLLDFARPATLGAPLLLPVAALAFIIRKDHRRYAAGEFRLSPGALDLTGDPAGPRRISPREIRDVRIAERMLLIRLRSRPTVSIHEERAAKPLEEIREAVEAWVAADDGRDAEAVAMDSARSRVRERIRRKIEVWAGVGAALVALAALLAKWLLP